MEGWPAAVLVLVAERRTDGDVHAELAACGADADLGICRAWLLVRAERGVHAVTSHAEFALDARTWRYDIFLGAVALVVFVAG